MSVPLFVHPQDRRVPHPYRSFIAERVGKHSHAHSQQSSTPQKARAKVLGSARAFLLRSFQSMSHPPRRGVEADEHIRRRRSDSARKVEYD